MRTVLRLAYWPAAIVILAVILVSLDYSLAQAVLISLFFCPCALALENWMPKARRPIDKVYLSLSILISIFLILIILHQYVWTTITQNGSYLVEKDVPPMLINPVFLGLILTALSFGDFYWSKWISRRFKSRDRSITFYSERKSITLPLSEIAYVESNDTEVHIVTLSGESYRNRTGIGQWENLLGNDFLRIHRSFLINIAAAAMTAPDIVTIRGQEIPVSRKYKESVKAVLSPPKDQAISNLK